MGNRPSLLGDAAIRPALRDAILAKYAREVDTILVEELGISRGQGRLDIAVVNGAFHGYEIKSDRDSLRRLDAQVALYGKVLDRATLVVGERHLAHAQAFLPAWWGVLAIETIRSTPRFRTARRGSRNPTRDPRTLVELLWLDEAIQLLETRNFARGVRSKPRYAVWDRVCEHFSVDEIACAVRARLKARAKPPVHP